MKGVEIINLRTYCITTLGGIEHYIKAVSIEQAIAKLEADFFGGEPNIVSWYVKD